MKLLFASSRSTAFPLNYELFTVPVRGGRVHRIGVTEGKDLEECRELLQDAVEEMIAAYQQQQKEIPLGGALIEQLAEARAFFLRERRECGQDGKEKDADTADERRDPPIAQPAQQHSEEGRAVRCGDPGDIRHAGDGRGRRVAGQRDREDERAAHRVPVR